MNFSSLQQFRYFLIVLLNLLFLSKSGIDLVFVVGHPQYYPRYGFTSASKLGFELTYSIPEEAADA
jgi:putative acetyltransferase